MTKNDIIDDISINTGISKINVKIVLEFMEKIIKRNLLKGNKITWRKFCTFSIKKRAMKVARNITKGIFINVPAHNRPYLKFSKSFILKIKKNILIN
ncbi:MAG: HU family DNA-binding protein [Candidatus Shikimatogenerans bostrichidophilus]|nr:MAG: HU family DNA-binding protein [Candidatus Shikimatogenerans bostrichidophilus]